MQSVPRADCAVGGGTGGDQPELANASSINLSLGGLFHWDSSLFVLYIGKVYAKMFTRG